MLNWVGNDQPMQMKAISRVVDKKLQVNNDLQGKTWLTALFCVVRCILYPRTKICVVSGVRKQANEVLEKIIDDFCKNYGFGSENLKREIEYKIISTQEAKILFHNGSWIKVVSNSDNARGSRANIIICDEFRMLDIKIVSTVFKKFLTAPRHPMYLDNPKYKDLIESNIEIYMTSAYYKSHWCYEKFRSFAASMLKGKKYFACALPYQLAIKEGLLIKEDIEDEMSEANFNEIDFSMEMEALFFGESEGSFFNYNDISKTMKINNAMYPSNFINEKHKVPELSEGERRILSVDVALMASKKNKNNDATSIILNRAMLNNKTNLKGNIVYLENCEGLVTDELVLKIRRLFEDFKCTDLVLDTQSFGTSVYDGLIKDIYDSERGVLYKALTCCNDKTMAERCTINDAMPVIWSIKASQSFNNDIAKNLRAGIKNNNINLLIPDVDCEKIIEKKYKGYKYLSNYDKLLYRLPYIQTGLLVQEMIGLKYEVVNNNIKVIERAGARKDRYSSLAYNYYVQCEIERSLDKNEKSDFATYYDKMFKLTQRPITY